MPIAPKASYPSIKTIKNNDSLLEQNSATQDCFGATKFDYSQFIGLLAITQKRKLKAACLSRWNEALNTQRAQPRTVCKHSYWIGDEEVNRHHGQTYGA